MKPLFLIPSHQAPAQPSKGAVVASNPTRFHGIVNSGNKNIQQVFTAPLEPNQQYHWVSHGGWSVYHLIAHALQYTGPVHMAFTTWAISEQSARSLVLWKENGQLLSISGILDIRAKTRHIEAYHLISSHCKQLSLAHLHAKVVVLHNQHWCVTILGSANFTENPRTEAGIIDSQPHVGQFHLTWINNLLNQQL